MWGTSATRRGWFGGGETCGRTWWKESCISSLQNKEKEEDKNEKKRRRKGWGEYYAFVRHLLSTTQMFISMT
jgi:hypothetical protein